MRGEPVINWRHDYFILGITGGLGSGKSAVSRLFEELGHRRMDADIVAREVLYDPETRSPLQEALGVDILTEEGEISREKIAAAVFGKPDKLERLNALIHPGVRRRFEEARSRLKPGELLVYDVPLLFEAGLEDTFDFIITVSASLEIRVERVAKRNDWSREEFLKREGSQMPLQEKEKRSDLVIKNEGSQKDLQTRVTEINDMILQARNSGPT